MKNIGLAKLLQTHFSAQFTDQNLPKEPIVLHGQSSTLATLTDLAFLKSLEALLNVWPKNIEVHLPDARDEASAIETNPQNARKLFQNKMGLLFNNVQDISPILEEHLQSLKKYLGLPHSTYSRCIVYATPDGLGTAAHFDQNINFVLQLSGTKKWWLAPNKSVKNPTERYTIGLPLDPELASYTSGDIPTAMPLNAQEVILKPGSILYVPRGYWHKTEADGEALALNFTFSQPTWIDLFTLALRSRLSLSPAWRELAHGVGFEASSQRQSAYQKFDALLSELVEDLPHWQAIDILGATEGYNPEK
jgi:50S ribosomal protein L16 3-hydroxylase